MRNALALFLHQDLWPHDTAHLLIWSDDGLIPTQSGGDERLSWEVVGTDEWIPLTRKYAPMVAHARATRLQIDAWVVWDDDDVYLPHHLAAHSAALHRGPWSHPSAAYSTYGVGVFRQPPAPRALHGRHYHGALAVRDDLLRQLGGWPTTDRSDYDKQMLAACRAAAGPPRDPCLNMAPSYVYRWADTGYDHVSGRSQLDDTGVRRYRPPRKQEPPIDRLTPILDASTQAILGHFTPR